mmetsp:Transcript_19455/g.35242  ORF Transcript_19455/g.35242 Transcript_19455/m.35242 type:complete len:119 (-) Transcript_19455:538-894(-)
MFSLRVCFEPKIKINLGFAKIKIEITICVVELNARVEITVLEFPLQTFPELLLQREEYQCIGGMLLLDVGIGEKSDKGQGIIPNGLLDQPSSWVLLSTTPPCQQASRRLMTKFKVRSR